MAFIRDYHAQGDPLRLMISRSGVLAPRIALTPRSRARGAYVPGRGVFSPEMRALRPFGGGRIAARMSGDPFLGKFFKRAFKIPKAIKKFQPGKAIASIAKFAAPIAAAAIPGVGGLLAPLLAGALAPKAPTFAPEPVYEPEPVSYAPEAELAAAPISPFTGWTDDEVMQLIQLLSGGR